VIPLDDCVVPQVGCWISKSYQLSVISYQLSIINFSLYRSEQILAFIAILNELFRYAERHGWIPTPERWNQISHFEI
jgi:hypothetical protein